MSCSDYIIPALNEISQIVPVLLCLIIIGQCWDEHIVTIYSYLLSLCFFVYPMVHYKHNRYRQPECQGRGQKCVGNISL